MIPSLLQIPSAVSDSKLHSVLPNNGKGDFQFERSTGATRINKDGLIEEVGYFSSELVQNGNFSELGSELIVNGDFATDTNWDKLNATINNGKATINVVDGAFSFVNQDKSLTSGKTFKLTAEVKGLSSSSGKEIKFQDKSNNTGGLTSANGTITLNESLQNIEIYWVANSNSAQIIVSRVSSGTYSFEIDNVSVKQVDPNDRWIKETGWSIANGKAIGTSTTAKLLSSSANIIELGKTYLVEYEISDYVSGTVRVELNGNNDVGTTRSANGVYVEYITILGSASDLRVVFDGLQAFTGKIDNVSVVEVQGDRPRLSYDITNGVVEKQPHLLLEPSSTNLFPFSEDYTQSNWSKDNVTITQNAGISPENLNNASKMVVSSNGSLAYIYDSLTSSSSIHTISAFVKADGRNIVWLYIASGSSNGTIYFDLSDESMQVVAGSGATPTGTITAFPNDWYKLTYTTGSAISFTGGSGVGISDAKGNLSVTADGTNGVLIYGLQLEQQSYTTSYIPTAGTTITRAAETCNNSKPSVNSPEGVLYAEVKSFSETGSAGVFTLSDGSNSNRVKIELDGGVVKGRVDVGGSGIGLLNYTVGITNYLKIALKWKASDFELWVNGSARASITSGSSFSANTLNEVSFDRGDGGEDFYGKVKGLAVYNEALSESQLMQLTGVTASSIYNNFVTRTASFTVEALNEVKKVIDNL